MFRQFWFSKRFLRQRSNFKRCHLPKGAVAAALIVLTLVISVHGYAQTPTPVDVRSEIRSLAASDVEDGISRRTSDAIKWYSGKAPGLTDQEIRKIYDEEYTKQTKVKKTDPRELLKPENGAPSLNPLLFSPTDKPAGRGVLSSFANNSLGEGKEPGLHTDTKRRVAADEPLALAASSHLGHPRHPTKISAPSQNIQLE